MIEGVEIPRNVLLDKEDNIWVSVDKYMIEVGEFKK